MSCGIKSDQNDLKGVLGDECQDYDEVALTNGWPLQGPDRSEGFEELRNTEKSTHPMAFPSLRHSGVIYKLNHGDLKVTRGGTGHAENDMIYT